ncbi:MAG: hypothetical protein JXR44_04590 [Thiotrichales bacterium]|nr:hypothetical protein [Thiotrichales bacterium]
MCSIFHWSLYFRAPLVWLGYLSLSIIFLGLSQGVQADDFPDLFETESRSVQSSQKCLPGVEYQYDAEGRCIAQPRLENKPLADVKVQKQAMRSPIAKTDCVRSLGRASVEAGDERFAEKMAIRDALKNATMQRDLSVNSDITMQNHTLTRETSRFVSRARVKNYTVLRAGLEEAEDRFGQTKTGPLLYEVELEVCLGSEANQCPDLFGRQYSPKVLIAPLAVEDIAGSNDLSNLVNGFTLELQRRLANAGQQNLGLLGQQIDLQPNLTIAPNLNPALLQDLYNQTGAQFILLTVLRSAQATMPDNGLGNQLKRFYDWQLAADQRFIELDWYLVDALNAQLLHQQRQGLEVHGKTRVGRERPFATSGFFATETGQAFDQLLNQQVAAVQQQLRCQPLEGEVVEIRDGNYYLLLNNQSGVQVGDDLAVHHRLGMPVQFAGRTLGDERRPGAFLRVTAVHAEFVVATLTQQADQALVQIGDRVKPW